MVDNAALRRSWARIIRSFLDFIIIDATRKQPMNGNELKQYAHNKYGVDVSSDAMYHRLARLERQRLIDRDKKAEEPFSAKYTKFYVATKQGVDLLNKLAAHREETKAFLTALLT
jgi:DNA-binding PadR family transcriptional regulator